MNRQVKIDLNVHGRERGHDAIWPTIIRRVSVLFAASALMLLLVSESHLSLAQRQQAFETSGVYP
ncbi:hypothetical protein [Bradyrhizobium sp. NAS80.1]|uniref:hypothetical protein n=1 Tax=Bradyrhizobium sp. NAS80.1 TaxID=1680159 RepID=UPI0009FBE35B|nr:hypothetical protein [Bradyrhizobium sp. NAS80.1]